MHTHIHHIGSRIDGLLDALWGVGGTDLLLTVGLPPMLRVDGSLTPAPGTAALTAEDTDSLLSEVLTPAQVEAWEASQEYDFSFSWRDHARIRGNAFTQRGLTAVALRMIPRSIPSPDDLGLPPVLRDLALRHQGLVLMTGPTGSGKSTTLASLIDLINQTRGCHIITVEDPIEYVHDHKMAAVNQREVGTDTANFPDALRSVLREDPDVLLVGEMRDLESIRFALTVAETGHLVFATLHTNDTAQSIGRMIDVFPAEQQAQIRVQLAAALSCVVYQRLVPKDRRRHDCGVRGPRRHTGGPQPGQGGQDPPAAQQPGHGTRDGMVTLEQSLSLLIQDGVVTTSRGRCAKPLPAGHRDPSALPRRGKELTR